MTATESKKDRKTLVRFQSKSLRVKGLAFHSQRPWILASLHNGVIQLWDYRMQVLLHSFEEHDGPVRGVDFHSTQPLFVSGGDDYKVKVWNYQLKRCLFTLPASHGHMDYIRTVQFHREYPWIISASDDQTIRIWNWQARKCIAVLTGHNHYVMCAQFHPTQDLIVSASLDQTVRVWDFSGLRSKNVSMVVGGDRTADLFGASDVSVKHVVEGHTRGVNWACFHKTLPLIVSGADDREVKLWRMNDVKVWEIDTMRGHLNNVSCVMFHPKEELVISNSEDKTIRIWDIARQNQPIVTRRDNDRFWILEAHPNLNLMAAGHDSGFIVFKLARERPPLDTNSKLVYFCKAPYVYECEVQSQRVQPVFSTSRSTRGSSVLSLQYNYANKTHHCVLLTDADGSYQLFVSPKRDTNAEVAPLRGFGRSAVFVSARKFAVLDKTRQIWIKSLENEVKTKIKLPVLVSHIFPGGHPGRILLRTTSSMLLYDVNNPKILNVVTTQSRHPVKYVVWSGDKRYVAMFSPSNIYVADSKLESLCMVSESTRIKSGAWDKCGVFVYSTSTHLKYLLPNGDSGIIRTLPDPIYITAIANAIVYYIGRDQTCASLAIDCTEYLFKTALSKKRNKEVLKLMESKKLLGRSIISYLKKKGYPEVALHFVEDPKIKFNLALECGNIAVALECATLFDNKESWHKLGVEALRQGNHQVVEAAYQKTKNFERLSFLYLITGNIQNLSKMLHIAKLRDDVMGRFHNSLYLGNVEERVALLRDAGRARLAYILAKAHGLEDQANALAAVLGGDLPEVPANAILFQPPIPVLRQSNWPLLEVERGFFDQIEDAEEEKEKKEDIPVENPEDDEPNIGGWGGDAGLGDILGEDVSQKKNEEEGGGSPWGEGLGIDLGDVGEDVSVNPSAPLGFVMPTNGAGAEVAWSQSTLAPDMVAAGNFQMAMHILNRQVGIVNFAPLEQNFIQVYNSAHAFSPALTGLAWQSIPLYRNDAKLPKLPFSLSSCVEVVKNGYKSVTEGKFQQALKEFRSVLCTIPLLVLDSKPEIADLEDLRNICSNYITAIRIELARKDEKSPERQAALAAYFTKCDLQPVHRILGLRVAIKFAFQIKNFKTTALFCRSTLELFAMHNKSPVVAKLVNPTEIHGVLQKCEKLNTDAVALDLDESKALLICARTLTPVYTGKQQSVKCPFCLTGYHKRPNIEDSLCDNCEMANIGATASGLRCFPE